jgi:UDP-N-acetylglucosamine 4-epimerase
MSRHADILDALKRNPSTWLVTGAAGFIGSHLVEALLGLGQQVTGLDDFSTGSKRNLSEVETAVPARAWKNFRMIEGSICDPGICREASRGVEQVLHQAGFVSVPLSLEDPVACNRINVDGFLNMLVAAREAGAKSFVYASSSAVYGDDETLPKVEEKIGAPLSPYGASKWIDEIYAGVFHKNFGTGAVGLRYFNVFGPRQNPLGGYAAVIPRWITSLAKGEPCILNGDGGISRDFCHVKNVVQANLLAALSDKAAPGGQVYNVAYGASSTLRELHGLIAEELSKKGLRLPADSPLQHPPRPGDIVHSAANISKARHKLGYSPAVNLSDGLEETIEWYLRG